LLDHHPSFPEIPVPQGLLENFINVPWHGYSYRGRTH